MHPHTAPHASKIPLGRPSALTQAAPPPAGEPGPSSAVHGDRLAMLEAVFFAALVVALAMAVPESMRAGAPALQIAANAR